MKQIKAVVLSIEFIIGVIGFSYAGESDSLKVLKEFDSPVRNPTSIEWYGANFWITGKSNSHIYKLDSSMSIVDSIDTHRSRISAICFSGNQLWFAVDSSVDTGFVGGKKYSIYRTNIDTKTVIDSLTFSIGGVQLDTNIIFGLSNSYLHGLCVSINAGWSSGVYQINTHNKSLDLLSYVPLSGTAAIYDQLWGIRKNSNSNEGNQIANISKVDARCYKIPFPATDMAFKEKHIFICNSRDSKIVEMDTPESLYYMPMDLLKEKLDGGWNWVNTEGGFGYRKFTPQSEGYSLTLVFNKIIPRFSCDSIGYKVYRNDSCIISEIASLKLDNTNTKWVVDVKPFLPGHITADRIFSVTDTLTFGYVGPDCTTSDFVRLPLNATIGLKLTPAHTRSFTLAGSSASYTILGRLIKPRQYNRNTISAQVLVSRSKAGAKAICKELHPEQFCR